MSSMICMVFSSAGVASLFAISFASLFAISVSILDGGLADWASLAVDMAAGWLVMFLMDTATRVLGDGAGVWGVFCSGVGRLWGGGLVGVWWCGQEGDRDRGGRLGTHLCCVTHSLHEIREQQHHRGVDPGSSACKTLRE